MTDETEYRYCVEFIFGETSYRLINLTDNLCMDLTLAEPVTEGNLESTFKHVCRAAILAGVVQERDEIRYITYPEGSQRAEVKGSA
jgi:hypothetical protein